METVDKHLVRQAAVVHCSHLTGVQCLWIEDREGKAPHLAFKGFPLQGCIVMSKATVCIACAKCQGMISLLLQDAGLA